MLEKSRTYIASKRLYHACVCNTSGTPAHTNQALADYATNPCLVQVCIEYRPRKEFHEFTEIPHQPDTIVVVLVVVIHVTIVQVHVPAVIRAVLRRRPIVVRNKTCHFIPYEGLSVGPHSPVQRTARQATSKNSICKNRFSYFENALRL